MMNKLKEFINERKQQALVEKEIQIYNDFELVERNGCLWLTHCGVAFLRCSPTSIAEDVAAELNKARKNAIEYSRL